MEVDKEFLCPDIFIESASFYCGYLRNNLFNKSIEQLDKNNNNNVIRYESNEFCINTSDCFASLPYLCEVNCTNQESKCLKWTQGKN